MRPAMPADASHLDWLSRSSYPPKLRSASVGEDSAPPTGQRRRDPFAIEPDTPVAEREDPSVEGNQLATRNPALDQPRPKPLGNQLPVGNHPMLLLGQPPNDEGRLVPRRNVLSPL
jgi:hypothetical protein